MITNITNITNNTTMNSSRIRYKLGVTYESFTYFRIQGLVFKDTVESLIMDLEELSALSINERLEIINSIKCQLESASNKGFLTSVDLRTFPVISDFLPFFFQSELSNLTPGSEEEEFLNGGQSMESYKWIYNLIILNLYLILIRILQEAYCELKVLSSEGDVKAFNDFILDLKEIVKDFWFRLDPSIRFHLRKPGLGIVQNTYVGFDTEFSNEEIALNSLISTQLAITTKSYIKIPRKINYRLSSLDVQSNKLTINPAKSKVFNFRKIEGSLDMCIQAIKSIKYGKYEESMFILNEGLKIVKGVRYFDDDVFTLFSLPQSVIIPVIKFGGGTTFADMVEKADDLVKPFQEVDHNCLMYLIKTIFSCGVSLSEGKNRMLEELYLKLSEERIVLDLSLDSGKQLPILIVEGDDLVKTKVKTKVNELKKVTKVKTKRKTLGKGLKNKGVCLTRKYHEDLLPVNEDLQSLSSFNDTNKLCITTTRNHFFIAHLTQADLSMFKDFSDIKEELSIVNGSFVTLDKPLKLNGRKIYIRDTMLLAPGGSKSLESIGRLYGDNLRKITLSKEELDDMEGFLRTDKNKFVEYGVRDALISLTHACWMEDFYFRLGGMGVPISLSSIGRKFVKNNWKDNFYKGYQISGKYLLGDVSTAVTPKGLNKLEEVGLVLPYYIANYKGGRNECFMYGIDKLTNWFDYDLISAYTTVMSMAGHPDYKYCRRLSELELAKLTPDEILYSYLIIKGEFEFPKNVKYPSIPCYVDENCTVYPLQGSCNLSGAEYLLAKSQNCRIKITEIIYTPFLSYSETTDVKPFRDILKLVQEQRREHAKGTISNLMYKEIGNSIYGSVVRGMSNKRKFDIRSKAYRRLKGDDLSNPLIASWTTAFVRAIIGECLNSIQSLHGTVVSVTTDGFITNIEDLESLISTNYLFSEFRSIRKFLSEDGVGLEVKSSGKGIIAWTTRGQVGIESKIIATTGLQRNVFPNKDELLEILSSTLLTESKSIEYIQTRLRSASDIYKRGGHVTMVYRDQKFRLHYDNRRVLILPHNHDLGINPVLLDSNPLINISQGLNLRFISKLHKTSLYSPFSIGVGKKVYTKHVDVAILNFIKGLLTDPPMYNLTRDGLETYPKISEYITQFNPSLKIKTGNIARLKLSLLTFKTVPKTKQSIEFINYVKIKFPNFDEETFYRSKKK